MFLQKDTENPFGLFLERRIGAPVGRRADTDAVLFMQSELAGDVTRPPVAVSEALDSWATVAVNSCCISKRTALQFPAELNRCGKLFVLTLK